MGVDQRINKSQNKLELYIHAKVIDTDNNSNILSFVEYKRDMYMRRFHKSRYIVWYLMTLNLLNFDDEPSSSIWRRAFLDIFIEEYDI